MIENTYLLWDIKCIGTVVGQNDAVVRIIAWTEEQAKQKAETILPGRHYSVLSVCEYWLPGMNYEGMAKALEKFYGEMAR